jgi:hypothetical protein
MNPTPGANSFEDRFVAYVDILGFSDIVTRAATDTDTFEIVRDALKDVDAQVQQLEEHRRRGATLDPAAKFLTGHTPTEMTAFSDCYLISSKVSDAMGAWSVFAAVQALGANLLVHDILTRGAVVCGRAYHHGRIAFGPAIIEAHNIERYVANYPRIIVTDDAREAIRWENENMWHGQLLRQDNDGCSFINVLVPPLSRGVRISRPVAVGDHFLKSRSFLEKRLIESRSNLRYLSKVRWLVRQFNFAAAEHGLTIINEDIE